MDDERPFFAWAGRIVAKWNISSEADRAKMIESVATNLERAVIMAFKSPSSKPDPRSPTINSAERIEERERRKDLLQEQAAQLEIEEYLREHPELRREWAG